MHLKSGKSFFFIVHRQGQRTLIEEYGIFFYYTLYKFIGLMLYFVLGHCTPKISIKGGFHNHKKNGPAMTWNIESGFQLKLLDNEKFSNFKSGKFSKFQEWKIHNV